MQKLKMLIMETSKKGCNNRQASLLLTNRGSILVAALAFSIIMAIAGSALLMLAANSVTRQETMLYNDKAFAAAETGLRIALRWLADTGNWDAWYINKDSTTILTFSIDGIADSVILDEDSGNVRLRSQATCPAMNYIKELKCYVERVSASSRVIFNGLDNVNGLLNLWFDGPVHSNGPIHIADPNTVRFVNGQVTVKNSPADNGNYGAGQSGNNYDYGILIDGLTGDHTEGDRLDSIFKNTFTHSQDSLSVPGGIEGGGDIVTLPSSNSSQPPILYFYVEGADPIGKYAYYDNGTQVQRGIIDNKILNVPNSVRVLGTVKGRVTVVTPPDSNIFLVGDIRYYNFDPTIADFDDYNPVNNYGVGYDNGNFIALVSGGNIHFDAGRAKRMDDTSNGTLADDADSTLYLTASLIAANPGKGITWDTVGGVNLSSFQYTIRAVGNRVSDRFFNYSQRFGPEANSKFRFYFDRRLLNNLTAPGVPSIRRITSGGNNLYLLKTEIREKNLPKS